MVGVVPLNVLKFKYNVPLNSSRCFNSNMRIEAKICIPIMCILITKKSCSQAKACKQLWVGGISQAVTKEDLEAEFHKFGTIEDFKFFRDRNTACVEFFNLEDACQAMKIMNGKRIGGEHIRVDFLRSQSTKRVSLYFYMLFLFAVLPFPFIIQLPITTLIQVPHDST